MEVHVAVELLIRGIAIPAVVAAIAGLSAKRFLSSRYSGPLALCLGVATIYGGPLLPERIAQPEWLPLFPEKHAYWLPWFLLVSLVPFGATLEKSRISTAERVLGFWTLSLLFAWLIVPHYADIAAVRHWYVFLLATGLTALMWLFDFLATRVGGMLLLNAAVLVFGTAGLLMLHSLSFARLIAVAGGALVGCAAAGLTGADDQSSARALAPHAALILGYGAFIGFMDPSEHRYLLLFAAPLILMPFAVGRWRHRRTMGSAALQVVLLVGLLAAIAAWLAAEQA